MLCLEEAIGSTVLRDILFAEKDILFGGIFLYDSM